MNRLMEQRLVPQKRKISEYYHGAATGEIVTFRCSHHYGDQLGPPCQWFSLDPLTDDGEVAANVGSGEMDDEVVSGDKVDQKRGTFAHFSPVSFLSFERDKC